MRIPPAIVLDAMASFHRRSTIATPTRPALDYVLNEAREAEIEVALSNAMGLGGHNGCVLVGRVE